MESIFDRDFYPTPIEIVHTLTQNINLLDVTILEPSAGKGNISEYCNQFGANVLTCEKQKSFQPLLKQHSQFLGDDCMQLKREDISHVQYIIMNPPFSDATKHILHLYEIAPEGCEIRSLINSTNLTNRYSKDREQLSELISLYGTKQSLGNCFNYSERSTDVDVSLIYLFKPCTGTNEFSNMFFSAADEEEFEQENSILQYSMVRDVCNRIKRAVLEYDNVLLSSTKLNDLTSFFGGDKVVFTCTSDTTNYHRQSYFKKLQKQAWTFIFDKLDMKKYMTNSVISDINKFVETQQNFPFTMHNVFVVVKHIAQTTESRMHKVIEEAFDKITRHYAENRFNVEGWKTNDCFMVNKKFIFERIFEENFSKTAMKTRYDSYKTFDDIEKALCIVSGLDYDIHEIVKDKFGVDRKHYTLITLDRFFQQNENIQFGTWYETEFFRFKGFKKGTGHFEFRSEEIWARFNQIATKSKGWHLPTTTEHAFRKNAKKAKAYPEI